MCVESVYPEPKPLPQAARRPITVVLSVVAVCVGGHPEEG